MIVLSPRIEETLQVNDYTLLDYSEIYTTSDLVSMTVDYGTGAIDILANKQIPVSFDSDGVKTITLIIENQTESKTYTNQIEVITKESDLLFSSDSDLKDHEDDILKYLPDNRKTYLDKHRASQKIILDELNHKQIYKENGDQIEKTDIANIDEVKQWSKYLTLAIIFENLSNQVDDIFGVKAKKYTEKASIYANRSQLRLKKADNTIINYNLGSGRLSR